MLTYPLVELPRALTAALESFPFPLTPPTAASMPTLPQSTGLTAGRLLRFGGWLLLVLAMGMVLHWEILAGLSAILAGGDWWWSHCRAARQQQAARTAYEEAFAYYLAYPALVAAHEQAQAQATTPAVLARYRAERRASVLAGARSFHRIPPGEYRPPRGRSEAYFVHYLAQNFGTEHIFTSCRVRITDRPTWYYPDIVYSDETGLRIDIEIDEPYVWATGEPHHYVGQDDARNAFFLQHSWVVLRLSEEQVVRSPMCCCQLLAALIFHLTGQHYAPRSYRERLLPQPQWDWQEAMHLAAIESRKSYEANLIYHEQAQAQYEATE